MPDFSNPFDGNSLERSVSKEEIVRMLRFAIAAEYEAVQLYQQIADAASDFPEIVKIMLDVADEEKVHAGEFLELLKMIDPDEKTHYDEGEQEVAEKLDKNARIVQQFLNRS